MKKMLLRYNVKIIAHGGVVNEKEISDVREACAHEFASIGYFVGEKSV